MMKEKMKMNKHQVLLIFLKVRKQKSMFNCPWALYLLKLTPAQLLAYENTGHSQVWLCEPGHCYKQQLC